jgi:hypothetical protein
MKRGTGCLADPPGKYLKLDISSLHVPKSIGFSDLRKFSTNRQDQGNTQSCVAQAVVKALEIKRCMRYGNEAHVDLSRRQIWYLSREMMNPPRNREDSGTYISFACDVLRRFGVAPEADFPWNTDYDQSPTWKSMRKAYLHRITAYRRITSEGAQRVEDCKAALAAGEPIVFGTAVGNNWFDYKAGAIIYPTDPNDTDGHHATTLEGWNGQYFLDENSWGNNWGLDGYCMLHPDVIASDTSHDFWTIQGGWEA